MKKLWRALFVLFFSVSLFACSTGEQENEQDHVENNNELVNEPEDNNESAENEDQNNSSEGEENNSSDNPVNNDSDLDDEYLSIDIFSDDSEAVLVNKFNSLSDYFKPEDLVTVEVPTVLENPEVKQMRKVAADALYDMFEFAKESDVYLHARSGFRSYETQIYLFDGYAEEHGIDAANQFSAKPGFSEHQTGLVMDVTSESVNYQLTGDFGETKEGLWLVDNAHTFGFIIRYPEGKEDITGYVYEPWHLRYLGVELATEVHESGLSYEEFLVEEGIIDEVNAEAIE